MNLMLYHIASGHSFFTGIVLIVTSFLLSRWKNHRGVSLARTATLVAGLLLVFASATPSPWFAYAVAVALTILARLLEAFWPKNGKWVRRITVAAAGVWLVMALFEVRWHVTPSIPSVSTARLFVIGDSVSAGVERPNEVTWPRMLSLQEPGWDIRDFSRMGATADSALQQAEKISGKGLVVSEIGGNDMMAPNGGTSPEDFERDLDALLTACSGEGRVLVMLELPLPPFGNRYGEIQRRLSLRHQTRLIPKRVLMGILTTTDATLDTIHLSRSGHALMSDAIHSLVAPAFATATAALPE